MTEINQKFDILKFIIKRKQCQVNFLEIDLIKVPIKNQKTQVKNQRKIKLIIKVIEQSLEESEK